MLPKSRLITKPGINTILQISWAGFSKKFDPLAASIFQQWSNIFVVIVFSLVLVVFLFVFRKKMFDVAW
jgi:hypothetical protein